MTAPSSTGWSARSLLPALMSPVIAVTVAAVGTWLIYRVTRGVAERFTDSRVPLGTDRQRLARVAGARHQRRAEDDGCDHARADRGR